MAEAPAPIPIVDPVVAPAPAADAAPVVEAGAAPPLSSPADAAPPAAAPAAEVPPASAATLVGDTPSLLESVAKPGDAAPTDKPAAEGEKPKEPVEAAPGDKKPDAKAADKPADKPVEGEKPKAEAEPVAPIEYKFELPPVIKDAPKEMGAFTAILGDARVPAEAGQKLLNLHAEAMTNYAKAYQEQALADQHKVFNDMRAQWRGQIKADPELGGAGYETTSRAIARMRDLLVPEGDRKSFTEFLRVTGAGDHPALWRMLHRAARFFDEPAPPPPGAKPTKTNGQKPGANVLYDNPRSNIGGPL